MQENIILDNLMDFLREAGLDVERRKSVWTGQELVSIKKKSMIGKLGEMLPINIYLKIKIRTKMVAH